MLLWNVRSINNKVDFIMQYIIDANVAIACITESWLTDTANSITFRIKNYGYNISHKHREKGKGGGVCFIYKPSLITKQVIDKSTYDSFEFHKMLVCRPSSDEALSVVCVYRKQEISFNVFCTEFNRFCENTLENNINYSLILGDFDIHFERNYSFSNQFENILSSFGLSQHVLVPTHKSGHILDILCTNVCEVPIRMVDVDDSIKDVIEFKFDHYPVTFYASFDIHPKKTEYITKVLRNINATDVDLFIENCENTMYNSHPILIFQMINIFQLGGKMMNFVLLRLKKDALNERSTEGEMILRLNPVYYHKKVNALSWRNKK